MEQKLQQSPQMIQAMQVLQLTTHELMDRIEAELEENPFLELEGAPEEGGEAETPEAGRRVHPPGSDIPHRTGDPLGIKPPGEQAGGLPGKSGS